MTAADQAREAIKVAALVVAGVLPARRARLYVEVDTPGALADWADMTGITHIIATHRPGVGCSAQTHDPSGPLDVSYWGRLPGVEIDDGGPDSVIVDITVAQLRQAQALLDAEALSLRQADGLACVVCGTDAEGGPPMAPVGKSEGGQVFACVGDCADRAERMTTGG